MSEKRSCACHCARRQLRTRTPISRTCKLVRPCMRVSLDASVNTEQTRWTSKPIRLTRMACEIFCVGHTIERNWRMSNTVMTKHSTEDSFEDKHYQHKRSSGAPCGSMEWNATDVVHVTMCDEHIRVAGGALRAAANVKDHFQLWQHDACLLNVSKSHCPPHICTCCTERRMNYFRTHPLQNDSFILNKISNACASIWWMCFGGYFTDIRDHCSSGPMISLANRKEWQACEAF
jgi:hypothetical protein